MSGDNFLYFPEYEIAFFCSHQDEYFFESILYECQDILKNCELEEEDEFCDLEERTIPIIKDSKLLKGEGKFLTIKDIVYLLKCREELNSVKGLLSNYGWMVLLISRYGKNYDGKDTWEIVRGSDLTENVIRIY